MSYIASHRQAAAIDKWTDDDKKECIRLYTKEDKTLVELSEHFDCSPDRIKSMLGSHGHLAKNSV